MTIALPVREHLKSPQQQYNDSGGGGGGGFKGAVIAHIFLSVLFEIYYLSLFVYFLNQNKHFPHVYESVLAT